jgi:hypothetical protein
MREARRPSGATSLCPRHAQRLEARRCPGTAFAWWGFERRESANEMIGSAGLSGHYLFPGGGAGLIRSVVEKRPGARHRDRRGVSTCTWTRTPTCNGGRDHIPTQVLRPTVCNAAETLLVDRAVAKEFLPTGTTSFCSGRTWRSAGASIRQGFLGRYGGTRQKRGLGHRVWGLHFCPQGGNGMDDALALYRPALYGALRVHRHQKLSLRPAVFERGDAAALCQRLDAVHRWL